MNLSRTKNITSKNIQFVFLFILLAFLLRFESYQPISENFLHYSNNSDVEFVISDDSQEDRIYDSSNKYQQKHELSDKSDLTNLVKLELSLLHFNNYLNHKFISLEKYSIQIYPLLSIIQKNNIWHQNTFDVTDLIC